MVMELIPQVCAFFIEFITTQALNPTSKFEWWLKYIEKTYIFEDEETLLWTLTWDFLQNVTYKFITVTSIDNRLPNRLLVLEKPFFMNAYQMGC